MHITLGKKSIAVSIIIFCVFVLAGCFERNIEKEFSDTFEIDTDVEKFTFTKVFDNYELGEGTALYMIKIDETEIGAFMAWDNLPVSEEAECFVYANKHYAQLPEVLNGKWKYVDRNKTGSTNAIHASLCVYDIDNMVAYYLTGDT
ncbi:MAG: hypothetical protein K6G60_05180 [Lachnospiraceae bacterium]|nr:hypothetical protein [Lachnospiraceae bacterium]